MTAAEQLRMPGLSEAGAGPTFIKGVRVYPAAFSQSLWPSQVIVAIECGFDISGYFRHGCTDRWANGVSISMFFRSVGSVAETSPVRSAVSDESCTDLGLGSV